MNLLFWINKVVIHLYVYFTLHHRHQIWVWLCFVLIKVQIHFLERVRLHRHNRFVLISITLLVDILHVNVKTIRNCLHLLLLLICALHHFRKFSRILIMLLAHI